MASKTPKHKLKAKALDRIKFLFNEAKSNSNLATRYVQIARKIGMKANQPILKDLKKKFCHHCYNYFQKGNYRVRTRDKILIYTCMKCNKQTRYKINKK